MKYRVGINSVMSDNNFVSIIVPCFNSANHLQETISSVLNQSYSNWELILVDDCSTDGTPEMLNEFASAYPNITAKLLSVNGGAGVARNAGLEIATGRFISFLDADDKWLPQKLEKQVSFMIESKAAISHTSYIIVDEEGNRLPGGVIASKEVGLSSYMANTEIGMSTSLIDRNVVGDFRLDTVRTRQDTKLWLGLLEKGFLSKGVEEILVEYRVRRGQISGNKLKMAVRTLSVYWAVSSLPAWKRILYFIYYCINALRKRL
jgi:teichuronic acid biosynthesis glycosyltransferase TuaG